MKWFLALLCLFFFQVDLAHAFEIVNNLKNKDGMDLSGGIALSLRRVGGYEAIYWALILAGEKERIDIQGLLEELEFNGESQTLTLSVCYTISAK